jgi:dephospho-CoA kinase
MTNAYIFAGLPGSGKSTAAEIGAMLTGGDVLSAGQMIRRLAERDGLEEPTSKELAGYAAERREHDGPGFFAQRAVDMIERGEYMYDEPLFIDSVRHRDGFDYFNDFFDETTFIWVSATVQTRLERLIDRGRDDEGQFSVTDLYDRDETELTELGQQTLIRSDYIDYRVVNEGTEEELKEHIEELVM